MGHGSRDVAGGHEFLSLVSAVAKQPLLDRAIVEPGWLEFAGRHVPPIEEAFARCVALGARRIAAVPAVLFAGGHATQDLPDQVELARPRFPATDIRLADMIGIDDRLLDGLVQRVDAATSDLPPVPASETAVLLADRAGGRWVEVGFLRLSRPYLQDAAQRCARLGARRVVVVPLLVNTGLLARRVPRKLVWLRQQLPGVELVEVPHLGVDPVLVELLARRAVEAFERSAEPIRTPVRLAPGQERCRPRYTSPSRTLVAAGA
jgi:sirohydrochlorin cobaltochelatase